MLLSNIEKLREILRQQGINAFIIPTSDPHQSEYIADYWKLREWICGFTGSAGTAVITENHAGLWTDSRYFTQAERQLFPPFKLHKLKTRQPEYLDWLYKNLKPGDKVGIDFKLISAAAFTTINKKFAIKKIEIISMGDIFYKLWNNRPPLPKNPVFVHPQKFNGLTRSQKIEKLRIHLKENKSEQLLISTLDDIAWLMNLRGNDIKFNPVFRAFVLVNQKETLLFADEIKINTEIKNELKSNGIILLPYNELENHLKNNTPYENIEVDDTTLNYQLKSFIPSKCIIKNKKSITTQLKAIKTPDEIEHYKNAQIRDGVAMCEFLCWLDHHIKTDSITEVQAAEKSEEFRSKQENYMGLSFDVISAYQENAALPHYTRDSEKAIQLKPEGMYLIDSGAQYLDGTTDITRTVALGKVTPQQIEDFTLVLKGHIRLASAKFPSGTKGFHLDTLARLDLWQKGKDFGHGTGHGIGYFLNVHEGPQGFSQAENGPANTIIEPGMLITNEPGIYIEGQYGIRIENVLVCIKHNTNSNTEFLKFETLSYCPIDKNLIDKNLLNVQEMSWLNNYHKKVYKLMAPFVSGETLEWLKIKTSSI